MALGREIEDRGGAIRHYSIVDLRQSTAPVEMPGCTRVVNRRAAPLGHDSGGDSVVPASTHALDAPAIRVGVDAVGKQNQHEVTLGVNGQRGAGEAGVPNG